MGQQKKDSVLLFIEFKSSQKSQFYYMSSFELACWFLQKYIFHFLCEYKCRFSQWTLIIASSLGQEKFACYNETLLYKGYKNNTIQRKSESRNHQNYLVIMKVYYISVYYNESPL